MKAFRERKRGVHAFMLYLEFISTLCCFGLWTYLYSHFSVEQLMALPNSYILFFDNMHCDLYKFLQYFHWWSVCTVTNNYLKKKKKRKKKIKSTILIVFYIFVLLFKKTLQGFPGVQRLRICLPMQGTLVWSLGLEDPTCCWATSPRATATQPVLWNSRTATTARMLQVL